jgi:hypothetical protein
MVTRRRLKKALEMIRTMDFHPEDIERKRKENIEKRRKELFIVKRPIAICLKNCGYCNGKSYDFYIGDAHYLVCPVCNGKGSLSE